MRGFSRRGKRDAPPHVAIAPTVVEGSWFFEHRLIGSTTFKDRARPYDF